MSSFFSSNPFRRMAAWTGRGGLLACAALAGCASLQRQYGDEVRAEIAKHPPEKPSAISETDIASLPAPLQRYFRRCGLVGRPRMANARVVWSEANLRRKRGASWMPMACRQFNSVAEPSRIVLMNARLAGFLPFEGRDKFQDGHGNMRIRLLKILTVGDVSGERMDQSALVTVLAEALLVPSAALQGYIAWEPVDSASARATMTWGGRSVSGVFHFDSTGEMSRFVTDDRYQDGAPVDAPIRWTALAEDYVERDGFRYPTSMRAVWNESGGDFEYFRGRIERLEFDVLEP